MLDRNLQWRARMDLTTIVHWMKIIAILVGVTLALMMLYDEITIPNTVDRGRVIKLALGAFLSLALAVFLILYPPENQASA